LGTLLQRSDWIALFFYRARNVSCGGGRQGTLPPLDYRILKFYQAL
jgi:hypothetical protein